MACIHDDPNDDLDERDDPLLTDQDDDADEELEVTPCPCCGRPTVEDADLCPHCGGFITSDTAAAPSSWWYVAAAVAALVAITAWAIF